MLLDILTLTAILKARNQIAAQQFLRELTCKSSCTQLQKISDYPKAVVLKAIAISGFGAKEWLQTLY